MRSFGGRMFLAALCAGFLVGITASASHAATKVLKTLPLLPAASPARTPVVNCSYGTAYYTPGTRNPQPVSMRFAVYLTTASSKDVTVFIQTKNGTAKAGQDYKSTGMYVTIKAGTLRTYVFVPVIPEKGPDPKEFLYFDISQATNATVGNKETTGFIPAIKK